MNEVNQMIEENIKCILTFEEWKFRCHASPQDFDCVKWLGEKILGFMPWPVTILKGATIQASSLKIMSPDDLAEVFEKYNIYLLSLEWVDFQKPIYKNLVCDEKTLETNFINLEKPIVTGGFWIIRGHFVEKGH